MTTLIKEITISNVQADEANLIVCVFCSDYSSDNFCGKCNEYKGLMMTVQYEEKNIDSGIPQRAKALIIRSIA